MGECGILEFVCFGWCRCLGVVNLFRVLIIGERFEFLVCMLGVWICEIECVVWLGRWILRVFDWGFVVVDGGFWGDIGVCMFRLM